MKLTKIIASALAGTLLMSVFCCGCSDTKETRKPTDDDKPVVEELPEDEILIMCAYRNEAWGHQSHITFVMSDGNVYSSSEEFEGRNSDWSHSLSDEDRALLLQKYTEPTGHIDEDKLLKIYQQIMQIDVDADFVYEDEYACDAGTHYTKVNVDGEWIQISESGDQTGSLKDRHARKADILLEGAFKDAGLKDAAHIYSCTETFIKTFECPGADLKNPRRIITNMDELKQFEKDTGINLEGMEEFEYFGNPDYDQFGWICIGVEIVQYDDYLSLEDVSADAFIVSENYTGFAYINDPVIDISDHVVDQKCYCHVVQIPAYNPGDYDAFLN